MSTDVYVKFTLLEDTYFKKKGIDVYTDNYVTLSQFLLGGKIKILTLEGIKEIDVLPYQEKIILEKYGINKKGDHHININVTLPKNLNKEQEKIFDVFKELDI